MHSESAEQNSASSTHTNKNHKLWLKEIQASFFFQTLPCRFLKRQHYHFQSPLRRALVPSLSQKN